MVSSEKRLRARHSLGDDKRESWLREQTNAAGMLLSAIEKVPDSVDRSLVEAIAHVLEVSTDPFRSALLTRSLNALAALAGVLEPEAIGHALACRSGEDVLLTALEEKPTSATDDPLAAARRRGIRMREMILRAEGGTWAVDGVAEHLGISRQAVDKRRGAGQLLALPIGQHRYAYPSWQFAADGMLPGFREVLGAFTVPGAWTQAAFFLNANSYLNDERPLDALRQGQVETVQRAASAFGEQGAA